MLLSTILKFRFQIPVINRSRQNILTRSFCSTEDDATSGEKRIKSLLKKEFPNAADIHVKDISGGCGSMYAIDIRAGEFKNLNIVNQHRLVHKVLKKEIEGMHGLQLNTSST
ncbi:bolA-like protein 3 [Nilaparvata lugens]|uniref:bolA-like protein 3 n=1 Tax=Nilaparvata lugens TaxID=108931 RepID=UPI00193D2521|nr:bolA-like protein 3 [Nilaparvata lugens]